MDLLSFGEAGKSVAYTGTAGTTANFGAGPTGVLVWATTDCYVDVGDTVTATSADTPMPAYTPLLVRVPNPQKPFRVSAIQISAGGTVYARPVVTS
jgi:hypothetical protein